MARPKNQAHRRAEVIAAAQRAINDRGVAGLRLKDIAAEAGLSIGSVHYYYPNMGELVFAVHRTTIENYLSERRAILATDAGRSEQLCATIRTGLPASRDDEVFGLFYELHSLAGRSQAHADLMYSVWQCDVDVYVAILEGGESTGEFTLTAPAPEIARRLVAFEDGLSVQVLSANPAIDTPAAIRIMMQYAAEVTGAALAD